MARKKILGLDLGTSSIGWSFIELDEENETGKISGGSSRIFEPPVEEKSGEPKNVKRRTARGQRRLLARRAMRRDSMIRHLVKAGLFPATHEEQQALMNAENPYHLRTIGLDNQLTPYQFGRALFHINERRGFKSNKKTDKKDKENSKMLAGISELEKQITASGSRTLGEHLYRLSRNGGKTRCRHTRRSMYEAEFETLWKAQQGFNPALDDELKERIRKTIFDQRPLRIQKGLVGLCSLEKKWDRVNSEGKRFKSGKKRCMRAHPFFQRFRFLQDVNAMKINGAPLTIEQRKSLIESLEKHQIVTWKGVRRTFKLGELDQINLERSETKELHGADTSCRMREAVGKEQWAALDEKTKEGIFEAITTIEIKDDDPTPILKLLTRKFGLKKEAAQKLAALPLELEPGYANLSLKAIKKLLPHLENGLLYSDAVIEAGYVKKVETKDHPKLDAPSFLRNPVVMRALHETRKVVNAICAKYGAPDEIRVELARDLKLSQRRKSELKSEQTAGKKERDSAIDEIKKRGVERPSEEDILKYRLWLEMECKCPYTGKPIGIETLFTSDIDIEHIIPFSRSLDDSFGNKTLCFHDENLRKGNRTPLKAYGADEQRWGEITQNIKHLRQKNEGKYSRFFMKELPDDLPSRYLNDTRYISREAGDYLRAICKNVNVTKGGITAILRREWGLNSLLHAPAGDEVKTKNRDDHRHHAIDAVVIALTTKGTINRLSRASGGGWRIRIPDFTPPWPSFRQEMEGLVKNMVVSHRPSRKISGALHEETNYGPTSEKGVFVYRKKVEDIKTSMLEKIRDEGIRKIIMAQVERHGGDIKKAAAEGYFITGKDGSKMPIKKVRIGENKGNVRLILDAEGKPYRAVEYGSNHHVEIFESPDGNKWEGRFVTMMEAARRARLSKGKDAIVNRTPDADKTGWKFIMSLAPNDMVRIGQDGEGEIYRLQKMSGATTQIVFRKHNSGIVELNDKSFLNIMPNPLNKRGCQKIRVTPIGEVKPAHD